MSKWWLNSEFYVWNLTKHALHGYISFVDYLHFVGRACFGTHFRCNLLTSCLLLGEEEEDDED